MFNDRMDAGRRLARELGSLRADDVVVFGLPRGGVPVAAEVAAALSAPLDVIVVRKLGLPERPELAMGAIGEGGTRLIDNEMLDYGRVGRAQLDAIETRERALLDERIRALRHGRTRAGVSGRTAIVVDDGMATGATMRVACDVARHLGASRVVVAVPVAPATTVRELTEADAVVCVSIPQRFVSVGSHYRDFAPVSEASVIEHLDAASARSPVHSH